MDIGSLYIEFEIPQALYSGLRGVGCSCHTGGLIFSYDIRSVILR